MVHNVQADPNTPEDDQALEHYGTAYEVLSDTRKRQLYDKDIVASRPGGDAPQESSDVVKKAIVDSKGAAIDLKDAITSDNPEDRAQLIGKAVAALGQSLGQGKL